jgi:hypothetical protein
MKKNSHPAQQHEKKRKEETLHQNKTAPIENPNGKQTKNG